MTTRLEPFPELGMVDEKRSGEILIDDKGRARDVARDAGAGKGVLVGQEEILNFQGLARFLGSRVPVGSQFGKQAITRSQGLSVLH
jgi:hypothetical protein